MSGFDRLTYLQGFLPKQDSLLQELLKEAEQEGIPTADPQTAALLAQLIQIHGSKRILEIGTATGYTSIVMARAMAQNQGHLTTIEIDPFRHRRAREYIQRAGLTQAITSYLDDASKRIPLLEGQFDFIFMDGAKGQYPNFFTHAYPKLAPGGVLVADNVLFRGMIIPGAVYPRRKRTLVVRLRSFLTQLSQHPALVTTVLPLGDGIVICWKKTI